MYLYTYPKLLAVVWTPADLLLLHCLQIFHGAESDIQWLQRDMSLYIVNMFDTYQAAKVLNFSGLSLSFLMKLYCDVNAEKHFQLADWRIRFEGNHYNLSF